MTKRSDAILTKSFCILCCVNFLAFLAFYMLIPVLPRYLLNDLGASKSVTGILLSLYVLSALGIRPLSGHLVDTFPRKPVFLVCLFAYALVAGGYLWITPLVLFGILRMVHGAAFGLVNTATTTLATDIIPPARMGTGMGFFGMTTAVPMALGPMIGITLYDLFSANAVFYGSLLAAVCAALLGLAAPSPDRVKPAKKISPGNLTGKLFLSGAGKVGWALASMAFVYGLILNYISVYTLERNLAVNVGLFFCFLAAGMILSRLFSGRFVDRGLGDAVVLGGNLICFFALIVLLVFPWNGTFFLSALMYGMGTGLSMPAYQTLFIRIGGPEQRGLANSSFFIAWDGGIGLALLIGGFIAEVAGYASLYMLGGGVLVFSALYYLKRVRSSG